MKSACVVRFCASCHREMRIPYPRGVVRHTRRRYCGWCVNRRRDIAYNIAYWGFLAVCCVIIGIWVAL